MANVLLVDTEERSGYLALSLVRGMGHRGSISICREDGLRKAETGLFDIFYVDVSSADPVPDLRLVQQIDVTVPGAPIIRVASPERELPRQPIFAELVRPITYDAFTHAVRQATAHLAQLSLERRRVFRKDVDLAVRVSLAERRLLARALNLSLGGALVELPAFELLDEPEMCELDFRLGRRRLHLRATIAYTRILTDGRPHLGVSFGEMGREEIEGLESLLAA